MSKKGKISGTQKPKWRYAKKNYKKTGDVRYAALIIGMSGKKAPEWAFQACQDYFKTSEKAHKPVITKNGKGNPGTADDDLLDAMAASIIGGQTLHAAAMEATTDDAHKQSNVRRLERKWRKEEKESPKIEDYDLDHYRLERAIVRYARANNLFLKLD